MPYKRITSGPNKGKYRSERSGRVVSRAQMQAIEINKHAGQPGATKPRRSSKRKG